MNNKLKMNWKKWRYLLIITLVLVFSFGGFGSAATEDISDYSLLLTENTVPVKIIVDFRDEGKSGVIQFPDVKSIDDDFLLSFYNALFSSDMDDLITPYFETNNDACSCLYVPIETESGTKTIMGRNMDLYISEYPAWIFYMDTPDRYKSFNIGYFEDVMKYLGMPTMDEIADTHQIPANTAYLLSYVVTDAINEKGLIIEANKRSTTEDLLSSGTNPSSHVTVSNAFLVRYLIDRCATIDDVLELVEKINIYSPNNMVLKCNFAHSIMDATGRFGVLEISNNKIIWHEGHPGHTNFWIDLDSYQISNIGGGLGRWESLQKSAKTINNEDDMWVALEKIYREQFYQKYESDITYDILSDCDKNFNKMVENSIELEKLGIITLDPEKLHDVQVILDKHPEYKDKAWDATYVLNPENRDDIITCYDFIVDVYNQLTPEQRRNNILLESTIFSYVTESGNPMLHIRFFENPEIYTYGFPRQDNSAKSPFPVFGILTGLGISVLVALRRRQ